MKPWAGAMTVSLMSQYNTHTHSHTQSNRQTEIALVTQSTHDLPGYEVEIGVGMCVCYECVYANEWVKDARMDLWNGQIDIDIIYLYFLAGSENKVLWYGIWSSLCVCVYFSWAADWFADLCLLSVASSLPDTMSNCPVSLSDQYNHLIFNSLDTAVLQKQQSTSVLIKTPLSEQNETLPRSLKLISLIWCVKTCALYEQKLNERGQSTWSQYKL